MEITDPNHFFYTCNGNVLKNLNEFSDFLVNVDDSTFDFHVNSGKNDFANWVRDIICDKPLAKKLFRAKTKEEMLKIVGNKKKRISFKGNKRDIISQIKNAVSHG